MLVEGSVALARPDQQFGERTTIVIPEAQFQLQMPFGRVVPYIGAGGGAAMDFRSDRAGGTISRVTASAAGGFRSWITPRVGIRGELRLRGIGSRFSGSAAEWTGGLSWRL